LTNSHAGQEIELLIELLDGASADGCVARILSGDIHAHNTFDRPNAVAPRSFAIDASGPAFRIVLPPASVVTSQIALS